MRRLQILLSLVAALAVMAPTLLAAPSAAEASSFPGWGAITKIYYNGMEETGLDPYLAQGAAELEKHLELVRPNTLVVTKTNPTTPAIRLLVRPGLAEFEGRNDDAFKLFTDGSGITITGKTPLAARHGAFSLLHDLGYRWFFAHPAWNVVPSGLVAVSYSGAVQGPAFRERSLGVPMGFLVDTDTGRDAMREWNMRNRLDSTETFAAHHSYNAISPLQQTASEHPSAVCYNADGSPRNLRPADPVVVQRAKNYGSGYFATPTLANQWKMSAPISPEDGAPKCPEWTNADGSINAQKATDNIFGLANNVAKSLQTTRPGKFAGVMSYNVYSNIPSIALEPNLHVSVATDMATVGTDLKLKDRLEGFRAKGVMTGVYEYFNVWQYTHDRPFGVGAMKKKLSTIPTGAAGGAAVFNSEAGNNWGAKGRAYWLASRMMWEPNVDQEALLEDFYIKAFGPAAEPMRRYFNRLDDQLLTDRAYGLSFRDIDEALRVAAQAGDAKVEARVRQMALYTYYDWRWGAGVTNGYPFSLEEMKTLYNYVWRMTNLHLITVKPEKGVIGKKLREQFGQTDAQVAALQDKTPPSATEVRRWLDEALSKWQGQTLVHAESVDPASRELSTTVSAQSTKTSTAYGGWLQSNIMVPSPGNETITATLTCPCPVDQVVTWQHPNGTAVASKTVTGAACRNGCTFAMPTTTAGRYRLLVPTANIKVALNRPAAHDLSQNMAMGGDAKGLAVGPASGYIHVAEGTPSLVIGTGVGDLTVTDPSGNKRVVNNSEYGVSNPAPGLWRLDLATVTVSKARQVWVLGVPPLMWNDPSQLLFLR